MGFMMSCCRRRRSHQGDSEPLLPKYTGQPRDAPGPATHVERLADVLAAFKAGKLPSQDQVTHALQRILKSPLLDADARVADYGSLSNTGREVITDMRDIAEAIVQFGLEKNVDDKLQDFFYQCRVMDSVPVHADIAVDVNQIAGGVAQTILTAQEVPSADEAGRDMEEILASLPHLFRAVASSAAFRAVLSDVWLTAREMLADAASDVSQVASQVQTTANDVERSVRPAGSLNDAKGKARDVGQDTQEEHRDVHAEDLDRSQESLVARMQEIMGRAHRDPALHRALRTILFLLRKYTAKARKLSDALSDADAPKITPVIWADPPLASAFDDLKIVLERIASGHSLDSALHNLALVSTDIANLPAEATHDSEGRHELGLYFGRLSAWFDHALEDTQYVYSAEGQQEASELYASGRLLVQQASESRAEWLDHIRGLASELGAFISAIYSDRTTQRLIRALDTLSTDLAMFVSDAAVTGPAQVRETERTWRKQLQRDILVWLVPRVLRVVKAIPMPRVEYTSRSLDAAIDALLVSASGANTSAAASLVPDRIRIANYSEIQRTNISVHTYKGHVDGMRIAARDIAYYVRYKGYLIGYEDQGLLSIEVGERQARGRGLSVDVELEFEGEQDGERADSHTALLDSVGDATVEESLFRVTDVKVDVPGLQLSIDRSKHWILNKTLLQPLAGPVARTAASYVLAQQIRTVLESCGRLGALVKRRAKELHDQQRSSVQDTSSPSFEDYWQAILQEVSEPASKDDESNDEEENNEHVETHTTATLKGVVRTTVTQHSPEVSRPPTPDETVLAVGVVPQILPGKGGPADELDENHEYGTRDVAREALGEVQERVDDAEESLQQAAERMVEVRESIDEAALREQVIERLERKKSGWRSRVFD
ncbi:uncharacterized protein B0H18DRAFT_1115809 [Fomitopsis serialis]|uniref:uncharacterized protein n=1 Tax=Fomitopsis serialis TaxID=139415 RepID=UPI00200803AE|nr:uncharacterized protein B0H18DRAFT_1115809 [Neoantrodia serialis]KAH9932567.1 hypothetical protein B0H18DRAFT_1115809 [Neoantrodia serialis]